MHIGIPEGSKLYVLGSVMSSEAPNDLDVLVVYDTNKCRPEDVYQYHHEMLGDLKSSFGLFVHATLLTSSEERGTDFIARTAAVPFEVIQIRLTHHSSGPPSSAAEFKR